MTQLGKIIITSGIVIFTMSALMWIIRDNWQYLAGGAAIFVGCILSGLVLSVETKNPPHDRRVPYHPQNTNTNNYQPPPIRDTERERGRIGDTDPYPTTPISGNWSPPANTPPPDADQDPFYGKKTDA